MRLRYFVLFGLVTVAFVIGGAIWWLGRDLPDPTTLAENFTTPSIRIVDQHGRLLYDVLDSEEGRHLYLPLAEIPLALQQATIATEDRTFYENPGVDAVGIGRALWINVRGGDVLAGGSTITQQVARNLLLSAEERTERDLRRKLREAWLAWRLNQLYTKDEILEVYLNQIYYGGLAYGVEAAAQTYFGKSARELTLAESALLAGLPQAPAVYNPLLDPQAATARQQIVLDLVLENGYVTETQAEIARRQPLRYASEPYPIHAPHFVMRVINELDGRYSEEQLRSGGGLIVTTTLDLDWQRQAEAIVTRQIERLNRPLDGGVSHNADSAALVALQPETGAVLALVGSPDYFDDEIAGAINMAWQPRQPGSTLKPFVYAAGMDPQRVAPFSPATMFWDVTTHFMTQRDEPYTPVNFSRSEHGPVLLRQALGSSFNIPAVAALDQIGIDAFVDLLAEVGIATMQDSAEYDLSLALGGGAVRLIDLVQAYAVLANGGLRTEPLVVQHIETVTGERIYEAPVQTPQEVIDPRVAWLISDILNDNEARQLGFGSHSLLNIGRTAAVKTGTTNDFRDNWTVGYTPDLVVGVWVGNADQEPMVNATGLTGAGPIWHNFMRSILDGQADQPFLRPEGLTQVRVCRLSGLLPTEACPHTVAEWFFTEHQPDQSDTFYQMVKVDRLTGRLATAATPTEALQTKVVLDLPVEAQAWARRANVPLLVDLKRSEASIPLTNQESDRRLPPLIEVMFPAAQATYQLTSELPGENQRLRIEAVTTTPAAAVVFKVDDQEVVIDESPPYEAWWPLAAGQHTIVAQLRHHDGTVTSSSPIPITVLEPPLSEGPPLPADQ